MLIFRKYVLEIFLCEVLRSESESLFNLAICQGYQPKYILCSNARPIAQLGVSLVSSAWLRNDLHKRCGWLSPGSNGAKTPPTIEICSQLNTK